MSDSAPGQDTRASLPLDGLRVVEVAAGVSAVGSGMASSLPGSLLRDLGADVARVQIGTPSTLDHGVEYGRAWHRGKDVVEFAEDETARFADTVGSLTSDADVAVLAGPEAAIERSGLAYGDLQRANPRLVVARIRPAFDSHGPIADFELLLHARTGLLTQLRGNRAGPVFCDLTMGNAGASLAATVGVLALLVDRERSGAGGWVETSIYDGVLAILPMIIGQVEHPSPTTKLLWQEQGPTAGLTFLCGDGGYLQLWFGAKGAYESFLEHVGDPPTETGYNAEMMSGAMEERSERWATMFASKDRAHWLADLAGNNFRCEPILRPGEALLDAHSREIGISLDVDDPERGPITVLGPVARVTPVGPAADRAPEAPDAPDARRLLDGVRVLDLSAYLAGPVAPQILGEFGADVVKVEPAAGDAHRSMEPLFAAGQRGKRAIALDLKAPDSKEVLRRLFAWSDIVHHNSRVGLADRLGYDEATVRAVKPEVIYSFASGFGETGPRALLPANDYLMQALSGIEAGIGGPGMPTFTSWGSVDVTGGWVSACAILAAVYSQCRTGAGQSVSSTLLGAGMLLKSGAFVAGDEAVQGPLVDAEQTGYGAAYRIYRGADDGWFALAVPDADTWTALLGALDGVAGADGLPAAPPPLRIADFDAQPAEVVLEGIFATRPAQEWVDTLRAVDVPVEPVLDTDRRGFISTLLDDPVNRQLGRVVGYEWGERGRLEQPALAVRLGPAARGAAGRFLPRLGQHTTDVLTELGFDSSERDQLAASGVVAYEGARFERGSNPEGCRP